MRHRVAGSITLLGLVLGAGCAAPSPGTPSPGTRTPVVMDVGGGSQVITLTTNPGGKGVVLDAPAARLWPALLQVYGELGLPVTADSSSLYVEAGSARRVSRIAGHPVADYFDCGGAYENRAASGDVYVTLSTALVPQGERTEVRTVASAVVRAAGNTTPIGCQSNGRLMQLVDERLQRRVAPSPPAN
jgi:hypothetical protein